MKDDTDKLTVMMANYSFAPLMTYNESGIEANHIPLILNKLGKKDVLQGHIAKANPLSKDIKDKSEVLIIFNGPNCYISPNYYPTKQNKTKQNKTMAKSCLRGIMSVFMLKVLCRLFMMSNGC